MVLIGLHGVQAVSDEVVEDVAELRVQPGYPSPVDHVEFEVLGKDEADVVDVDIFRLLVLGKHGLCWLFVLELLEPELARLDELRPSFLFRLELLLEVVVGPHLRSFVHSSLSKLSKGLLGGLECQSQVLREELDRLQSPARLSKVHRQLRRIG